jgi:hypothetical protein
MSNGNMQFRVVYSPSNSKNVVRRFFDITEKGAKDAKDFLEKVVEGGGTGTAYNGTLTETDSLEYWLMMLGLKEPDLSYTALKERLVKTLKHKNMLKRGWHRKKKEMSALQHQLESLEKENEFLTMENAEILSKYENLSADYNVLCLEYESAIHFKS